jgi:dCMP deaminase
MFPNDLRDEKSVFYLKQAYAEASKSADPSTQNGAVLVSADGLIIGRGYNRFAKGVKTTPERLADRNLKYPRTAHAEKNAIWDAIHNGYLDLLDNATLYVAWYACDRCADTILESGIRRVVGHRQHPGVITLHSKWAALVEAGLDMLQEGGVECLYYDDGGKGLGCEPLLLDYKLWTP